MIAPIPDRHAQRMRAVMALFRGEDVAEVSAQYQIGRSNLYKFRRRALTAIEQALAARRRGPGRAHNHVATDSEAQVVDVCKRHPNWSSYAVHRRCGTGAPSPRTIQRIRTRHGLGALFETRAPDQAPRSVDTGRPSARRRDSY